MFKKRIDELSILLSFGFDLDLAQNALRKYVTLDEAIDALLKESLTYGEKANNKMFHHVNDDYQKIKGNSTRDSELEKIAKVDIQTLQKYFAYANDILCSTETEERKNNNYWKDWAYNFMNLYNEIVHEPPTYDIINYKLNSMYHEYDILWFDKGAMEEKKEVCVAELEFMFQRLARRRNLNTSIDGSSLDSIIEKHQELFYKCKKSRQVVLSYKEKPFFVPSIVIEEIYLYLKDIIISRKDFETSNNEVYEFISARIDSTQYNLLSSLLDLVTLENDVVFLRRKLNYQLEAEQ